MHPKNDYDKIIQLDTLSYHMVELSNPQNSVPIPTIRLILVCVPVAEAGWRAVAPCVPAQPGRPGGLVQAEPHTPARGDPSEGDASDEVDCLHIMLRGELPGAPVLRADVLAVLPRTLPRLGLVDVLVAVARVREVAPVIQTL